MDNRKLWRYYDLIKFLTLINGEIYFARADKFKDKFEGAMPKRNFLGFAEWMGYESRDLEKSDVKKEFQRFFDDRKKKVAISCWHLNECESAAMWDLYSKAGNGIAVSTTLGKLNKINKPDGFELEMFEVNYIDFDKEYRNEYMHYELLPFKNKRMEFQHEQEFRVMLFQNNPNSQTLKDMKGESINTWNKSEIIGRGFISRLKDISSEGIKIPVNASDLIDEIIASPYMKEYEVREIQRILDMINREKGTEFRIKPSDLYEDLMY